MLPFTISSLKRYIYNVRLMPDKGANGLAEAKSNYLCVQNRMYTWVFAMRVHSESVPTWVILEPISLPKAYTLFKTLAGLLIVSKENYSHPWQQDIGDFVSIWKGEGMPYKLNRHWGRRHFDAFDSTLYNCTALNERFVPSEWNCHLQDTKPEKLKHCMRREELMSKTLKPYRLNHPHRHWYRLTSDGALLP